MVSLPISGWIFAGSAVRLVFGGVFVVLVLAACVSDVRERRIPNTLVATLALAGLAFSLVRLPSTDGLVAAFAGIATGLAIWIVFYALGVLGAGDVKFFAAASAWLGPSGSWRAALVAAVIGGVLAVGFLLRESRLGVTLHRLALMPIARRLYIPAVGEMSREEARRQLPYGVALAGGVLVMAVFPGFLR